MKLATASLLGTLLIGSLGPLGTGNAAPDVPYVLDPSPRDSTGAAVIPPDSVIDPEPITVLFAPGVERHYARVEPWPHGLLRAYGADGSVQYLERSKIRMIHDERENLTQQILDRGKAAGEKPRMGAGEPPVLRGRPLPIKKGFPLIQAGLIGRIDDHEEAEADRAVAFDLGVMENISPRHSFGITLGVVTDVDYTRIALKPRLRQWLGKWFSLDVSPGVFLPLEAALDGRVDAANSVGLLGELSLSAGDWVSLTALVEVVEKHEYYLPAYSDVASRRSYTDVSSYLGLKAGGEAGIVTSVLMAVAIAAATSP